MPSSKFGSKFLGEERYQQYVNELTAEGTVGGEQLSPEERKEGFKKRNDKIGFQNFVDKVLEKKQSASVSKVAGSLPGEGRGGALIRRPTSAMQVSKVAPETAAGGSIFDEILKIVTSIRDTLIEKNEFDADQSKKDKQSAERQARGQKEKRLESNVFAGIAKGVSKVLAPVKGLFEKVFDFIKTVILGRVVVKLIDWFTDKENERKVKAIGKFLEKTWPALLAAYLLFGNSLGRFVTKLVVMVGKFTAKLISKAIPKLLKLIAANPLAAAATAVVAGTAVAMVAANQDGTAVVKDPEDPDKSQADEIREFGGMTGAPISADMLGFSGGGMTPMGTDTVPAMLTPGEFVMSRGAVNTFGSGFMEMINAAGGGTNKPKNGYFSAGGYVPGAPDAKDKGEYTGGRSMAARMFDPLQVFSKDKPDSSSGSFDSFAKEMIKVHEGLRLDKYLDSRGFPTIGYGHLIEKGESMPDRITKEKADELFDEDYMHHKKAAEKIPGYNRASGEQKAAIIDLTFNMGPAWADGFPAFKKAFAAGDYQTAGDELINSAWYGQVGRRAPTIVNLIKGKGTSGASYLSSVPAVSSPASASSVMPSSPTTPPPVSAPPPTFDYKKIRQELGVKTSSVSKSSRPSSTAAYTQMQQGQQQSPQKTEQSQAPDIPAFDAAAMSSPKKIKTLGITV
jgi:GH24 family phage-related lysozyme (muramidase)